MCRILLPYLLDLPAGPIVRTNDKPLKTIESTFDRLKARGVPVWEVAGFLGHSSGYRTTERYAKYGPDYLDAAVRALDAYLADLGVADGPMPEPKFRPAEFPVIPCRAGN